MKTTGAYRIASLIRDAAWLSVREAGLLADRFTPRPVRRETSRGLALVHRGRCGSTVLGSLLDQNAGIYWDGEALSPHRRAERWFRRLQGVRGVSNFQDLQALMRFSRERVYVLSAKGNLGYTNFALLVKDLLTLGFDRFVILERKNALRWLVSAEIGTRHQVWHLTRKNSPGLNRVRIPLTWPNGQSLAERLCNLQNWYEEVRRALKDQRILELDYETAILPDPNSAYRSVCGFLDLEATPVRVNHQRVNPFPLHQIISNFEEVSSALRATDFEWMLTE